MMIPVYLVPDRYGNIVGAALFAVKQFAES